MAAMVNLVLVEEWLPACTTTDERRALTDEETRADQ
jgi:hypothetical protein